MDIFRTWVSLRLGRRYASAGLPCRLTQLNHAYSVKTTGETWDIDMETTQSSQVDFVLSNLWQT